MKHLTGLLGAISLLCLTDAYKKIPSKPATPPVCPCIYNYDPVCGSDGVIYYNKCVLEFTSAENTKCGLPPIEAVEDCECSDCNCQEVDLPVCTLDGETFPNECELECENLKRIAKHKPILELAYRTECRGASGQCTAVTAPVCGTDNVDYRNKCVLNCVSAYNSQMGLPPLTVQNKGACKDSYLCPVTEQKVCGSDGNYYNNPCELAAENERRKCNEVAYLITEAPPSVCNECRCPKDIKLVCGSDGNTYLNLCQLECEIEKQKYSNLKLLYKGACQECDCKDEYRPVCGTDRKTYDNECLLECENIGRSENLPPLEVFHVGECQIFICECSYCDDTYQPVCGSDGQTYWNPCWLKCNDNCCQKNGLKPVYYAYKGPCK